MNCKKKQIDLQQYYWSPKWRGNGQQEAGPRHCALPPSSDQNSEQPHLPPGHCALASLLGSSQLGMIDFSKIHCRLQPYTEDNFLSHIPAFFISQSPNNGSSRGWSQCRVRGISIKLRWIGLCLSPVSR